MLQKSSSSQVVKKYSPMSKIMENSNFLKFPFSGIFLKFEQIYTHNCLFLKILENYTQDFSEESQKMEMNSS